MNWLAAAVTTINSSKGGYSINSSSSKLLKINVGGVSFILMRSVLEQYPDTLLGMIASITDDSLSRHSLFDAYIQETGEIFFNRSGLIFHSVAEFYHTGHLHKLHSNCNTSFWEELKFWGIYPAYHAKRKCKECFHTPLKGTLKRTRQIIADDTNTKTNIESSETYDEKINIDYNNAQTGNMNQIAKSRISPNHITGVENDATTSTNSEVYKPNSSGTVSAKLSSNMELVAAKAMVDFGQQPAVALAHNTKMLPATSIRGYSAARNEIWKVMEGSADNRISLAVNIMSIFFILLNTSLIILDSIPTYAWTSCAQDWIFTASGPNNTAACDGESAGCCYGPVSSDGCESHTYSSLILLYSLSWICTAAFTIEFIVKLCTTPSFLKFFKMPTTIIDILAIAPDYIETIVFVSTRGQDKKSASFLQFLQVLRVVRIFRVFRIIKIARFEASFHVLGKTVRECMPEFALLFVYLSLSTMIFGTILYYVEFGICGTPFVSIPRGIFWAVVTCYTFADASPATDFGRIVAVLSSVFGIVLMAMPVSILVDKFSTILSDERSRKKKARRSRDSLYDEFGRIKSCHDEFVDDGEKNLQNMII